MSSNGSFYGRYEAKISEFESRIKSASDVQEKKEIEQEMYDYMASCIPFMNKFSEENTDKHTIDSIFGGGVNSKIKKGTQRKEIFHEYLRNVERYTGIIEDEKEKVVRDLNVCKYCKSDNIVYLPFSSENICENCGSSMHILVEELSYKEEQDMEKVVSYSYKRDNHLNELILQFQANETTNIPKEVIEQLRSEFKKQRVSKVNEITHAKVRDLLKKLRLNKYYDHVPYITTILN
jgi:hypothetical protein